MPLKQLYLLGCTSFLNWESFVIFKGLQRVGSFVYLRPVAQPGGRLGGLPDGPDGGLPGGPDGGLPCGPDGGLPWQAWVKIKIVFSFEGKGIL